MTTSDKIDCILNDFKKEAADDVVGLWAILKVLRENFPNKTPAAIRKMTIDFVRLMLSNRFQAGDPPYSAMGYRRWENQNPDDIIARIEREWDALGHEPNIPDIVWFDLPTRRCGGGDL
jgi:hypothetical protein